MDRGIGGSGDRGIEGSGGKDGVGRRGPRLEGIRKKNGCKKPHGGGAATPSKSMPPPSPPSLWTRLIAWLRSWFFSKELEVSIVGLQNAGKTSLVHALTGAPLHRHTVPTVGFTMRKIKVGGVEIKCWDLGGQVRIVVCGIGYHALTFVSFLLSSPLLSASVPANVGAV